MTNKKGPFCLFVACTSLCIFGCGVNDNVLRSGKETPIQANVERKSDLEADLDAMHTAGFNFIYILRRKDGGAIASDDINVIKQQTVDTNRRVKTDSDRAVIIGSNYQVSANSMAVLSTRFLIEDHSPPPSADANVSANLNK